MQTKLREYLHGRGFNVTAGSELGGGETDLILDERIVVENKVRASKTRDPFDSGKNYAWQGRRYSIPLCSRVGVVVVAYRPADERAVLPLPDRIRVRSMCQLAEERCEIRVVVPWGHDVPSSAKSPEAERS